MDRAEFLSGVTACAVVAAAPNAGVGDVVAQTVRPLMQRYGIPGMAVGIAKGGATHVFEYGVASKATGAPVASDTLFEIGSITKTFTATLASYAQLSGKISLADMASTDFPALRDTSFDRVSLLNLATHTSGGLPLQVPDGITTDAQLLSYLQRWKPSYPPGTYRVYSNVGIGTLGLIVAGRVGEDFTTLMQTTLLTPLGLKHTYLDVPEAQMGNYAQGYTSKGIPIRMTSGVLAAQAYGIRTTAADLLRFLRANLRLLEVDDALQRALTAAHTGYYRVGAMTQDLIWEQYRYPVTIETLLQGNSAKMLFEANPAIALDPPLPPRNDVLVNKTGSTNGFGAYAAFIPEKKFGIVLLANKSYPIEARVTAAYRIYTQLRD